MYVLALRGASYVKRRRAALRYQRFSSGPSLEKEEEVEEEERKVPVSPKQHRAHNNKNKKRSQVAHDFSAEVQTLCLQGKLESALQRVLLRGQLCPTRNVYLSLLKACIQKHALPQVMQIHAHLIHHKAELTGVLGDYLVVTLAKCGAVELARQISDALPCRTVYSWTSMIAAYTDSGQAHEALNMYRLMQDDGIDPDHYTFVSLLKACGSIPDLEQGKQLHHEACQMGFASDVFVGNTLVSMYGKCGDVSKAENVFCDLSVKNTVAYNALLSLYVEQGCPEKVLLLYRQMQEQKVNPDGLTFGITIQACHALANDDGTLECTQVIMALEIGRALHHDAYNMGLASVAFVGSMLVSLYGKCGMVAEAEFAFCTVSSQDVKTWTQMLAVYVEQGQGEKALQFYSYMHLSNMSSDSCMFVTALQACTILLEKGEASPPADAIKETAMEISVGLHKDAQREGYISDVFVATALLTVYGKFGRLVEAENIFEKLSQRTIVSWTAMLSAYIEQGEHPAALLLYKRMQEELAPLDDVTIICILQACREMGNLNTCEELHFAIVSGGYGKKVSLPSTLVHCYANCASMADAHAVFDELAQPDVVSWSACMAGFAGVGSFVASLKLLEAMQLSGIKPNEVTYSSVLSACSHAGFAPEGLEYFHSMSTDHCIPRESKHYANMTDLLGRAGDFKKLEDMLSRMPMQADLTIWLCLLGMCLRHGNLELGNQAFHRASDLHPTEAVTYILMSNIYADAAQLDSAREMNVLRLEEDVGR